MSSARAKRVDEDFKEDFKEALCTGVTYEECSLLRLNDVYLGLGESRLDSEESDERGERRERRELRDSPPFLLKCK